ncbi:cytosine deaminase [Pseudonocardia eucalypti]|uniref:Cytosine deaminase n=1 Tax=Pseudonocardia eucalypti TaxID=648755 RepID=A0ABP9QTB4_9PSEU|nr:cytosine deaminase [Pseudonocardia eucalypti]
MIDLLVRGARPLDGDRPVDLHVDAGRLVAVRPAGTDAPEARQTLDAAGALLTPPYVEPHVHLDTCLTAGQPRWNASGTLWEGIACWSERKATLTGDDVARRAEEVLRWYAANGALHVRSHVDVTDPDLVALDAMLALRERVRDVLDLQLVAFPQEGICSFPDGEKLLAEAARRGVDVIGAIPHFEDTREDGVRSVEIAVELAERHGVRVDAHCDEIDDDHSRFIEVLATQAHRRGLGDRVTASHTTAMGSYNAAYSQKLHRIIARSGINLVCNPMVNLHLQGRLDGYPRRRGLTQVKELLAAGINVAFGGDDVMDPWYPLGTANPLQVAHVGTHATQLTAPAEVAECFRMVTDRAAAVLGLGDGYGVAEGRPANFLLLPATDRFDAVRRQVAPSHVVSRGRILATTPPRVTALTWLDGATEEIDFQRRGEPGWRDAP